MIVPGLDDPCVRFVLEYAVLGADLFQLAKCLEDDVLPGALNVSKLGFLPVHVAPVQVAAVVGLDRIIVIGVIVELTDLIARVQDRDSALGQQESVEHDVEADAAFDFPLVLLVFRRLDPAEGSCRSAESGVAQAGIVIVKLAAGVTVVALAGEIVVEVFLVRHFRDAELLEIIVVQAPADVVVAAQVVQECVLVRQRENCFHLMAEQAHVVCRHCVPCAGHGGHVVEHVAFRLLDGAKIGNDLARFHNNFAQEQRSGADDLGSHVHQTNESVHLGQVAARRADLFPDVRRRVQTDDIHAVVAEVEHVSRHVIENDRIRIVQIPLIGPECGHDNLVHFRAPGEVAGCCLREYLRNGLLELVRNGPVIVEEVTVLILLLSCLRAHSPLVVLTGVVHDEVKAHAHSAGVAVVSQLGQVFHGSQLGLNLAEVGNSISAVASVLGALQQGHQVQIVDAALLDVIQMALHTFEIAGEAVRVHEHTEHVISLVPVGRHLTRFVPLTKHGASLLVVLVHHVAEVVKSLLVVVVQLAVEPFQFIVVLGKTVFERLVPFFVFKHITLLYSYSTNCNRFHYKLLCITAQF